MPETPRPLLTIYTPTHRRPQGLARCIASVEAQTDRDVQHLIIEDTIGVGVAGMFAAIPRHHDKILGEWVFILSDDDVLPDAEVVADLRQVIDANPEAEVIMGHCQIGGIVYPTFVSWGTAPAEGHVTMSGWIVRREVFVSVPYGHRYEGDFDFIHACWERGLHFTWWPRLLCRAAGWGRGAPEEGA